MALDLAALTPARTPKRPERQPSLAALACQDGVNHGLKLLALGLGQAHPREHEVGKLVVFAIEVCGGKMERLRQFDGDAKRRLMCARFIAAQSGTRRTLVEPNLDSQPAAADKRRGRPTKAEQVAARRTN